MSNFHIDDEDAWIEGEYASSPLLLGMRALEQNLRCQICTGFYRNPVSVQSKNDPEACQHTFCSECIRMRMQEQMNKLKSKPSCPGCLAEVDVKGMDFSKCLRPNRSVELLVQSFTAIRENLKSTLMSPTANQPTAAVQQTGGGETRRRSSRNAAAASVLPPPVADEPQTMAVIDITTDHVPVVKPPKKSRPVLSGLNKKKLQELCRQEGLTTAGDEKDLRKRYEAFYTLYAANRDSLQPRPVSELVQEITARERAVKQQKMCLANHTDVVDAAFQKRNGAEKSTARKSTPAPSNAAVASFNDGFKNLIQQVKERKLKEKAAKLKAEGKPLPPELAKQLEQQQVATQADEDQKKPAVAQAPTPSLSPPGNVSGPSSVLLPVVSSSAGSSAGVSESKENVEAASAVSVLPRVSTFSTASTSASAPLSINMLPPRKTIAPKQSRISVASSSSSSRKKPRTEPTPSQASTGSPSIIGSWSCTRCTFHNAVNTSSRAKCQMCGQARGAQQPQPISLL